MADFARKKYQVMARISIRQAMYSQKENDDFCTEKR